MLKNNYIKCLCECWMVFTLEEIYCHLSIRRICLLQVYVTSDKSRYYIYYDNLHRHAAGETNRTFHLTCHEFVSSHVSVEAHLAHMGFHTDDASFKDKIPFLDMLMRESPHVLRAPQCLILFIIPMIHTVTICT